MRSNSSKFEGLHRIINAGVQHGVFYPAPSNLNYFWSYGSIVMTLIVWQVLTGILLAIHYIMDAMEAFSSVERVVRDVSNGWFLKFAHTTGASLLFIVLYIHIGRGIYARSFKQIFLWNSGVLLYVLMMCTAFMGYVLPWGQMSYWAATVITNLVSVTPLIGQPLVVWIWGGFSVSSATLRKFFILHVLLPFLVILKSVLHIYLLHIFSSLSVNSIRASQVDTIMFYPKLVVKDIFFIILVLGMLLANWLFWFPDQLGHPDNYVQADALVTPAHIAPEFYFLPFYAMLRAVPNKEAGVLIMVGAILLLFIVPFLMCKDSKMHFTFSIKTNSRVSMGYKILFWMFILNFFMLGFLGAQTIEPHYVIMARCCTLFYFSYFLVFLPCVTLIDSKIAVLERLIRRRLSKKLYPVYFSKKRFEARRLAYLIKNPFSYYGVLHFNHKGLF